MNKHKRKKRAPDEEVDQISFYIENWIPNRRYRTEEGYQSNLRHFLEYEYNLKVRENYGSTRADILVNEKIPVEFKKNPRRRNFDALTGQVDRHIEAYGHLIVIICDLKEGDLFKEYKERITRKYPLKKIVWITK